MIHFSDQDHALPEFQHPVVTLGTFDGVHRGHQEILRELHERARARDGQSVVVTFDPHPRQVLNPAIAPDLLTTTGQKLGLMAAAGVDAVCLIEFTREFAKRDPEEFVRSFLVDRLRMEEIVIGYDTRFGMNRRGDRALLEQLSVPCGYAVAEVPPLQLQDMTVSSSLIRELVQLGDLKLAQTLLGRRFSFIGEIVRGEGLGKKLGFPTANIHPFQEVIPPNGVYAVYARLGPERLRATMNIGTRPTMRPRMNRTIEAYIHDFDQDLYGAEIEVTLVERLRDEQRFDSVEALKAQIAKDVAASEQLLLAAGD